MQVNEIHPEVSTTRRVLKFINKTMLDGSDEPIHRFLGISSLYRSASLSYVSHPAIVIVESNMLRLLAKMAVSRIIC